MTNQTITQENRVQTVETRVPVSEAGRDTHAIGTGVGAAVGGIGGAAAGAAVSAATGLAAGAFMGGPVGATVGLVAGALAGGVLGSEVGEAVNPSAELHHWSTTYMAEPYYISDYSFDDYLPAYRTGYEGFYRYAGKSFEDVEGHLHENYISNRGNSRLTWVDARPATLSAWNRLGSVNRNSVN